jgi:PKD repeat protein
VGDYTVTLTAVNLFGVDSITGTVTVALAPTARFTTTTPTAAAAPTQFNNASTGDNLAYLWDFGDGSAPVTATHPIHIYEAAGVYTATLTAVNPVGSDTFSATVRVMARPSASLSGPAQGNVGGRLYFSATANGEELLYRWEFGDGSPPLAEPNVSHVYAAPGVYTVTLTVTNPVGAAAATQLVNIDPTYYLFVPYTGGGGVANPEDRRITAPLVRPGTTTSGSR